MNKKLSFISGFIFFILISCDSVNSSSITLDDYEKASFHMGRGLNKYLNNVLTNQKWDEDDFFNYKVKFKDKSESFSINLKSLEKSNYKESNELNSQIIDKN